MNHRRGLTLIELLVVTSASVMVLGLIAGLISSLARAERSAERHIAERERIYQLCESFRRYAWAATSAECVAGENGIELTFEDDRKVELRVSENRLIETGRARGQVTHEKRCELPRDDEVRFAIRPEAKHTWVSMTIERRRIGQPINRSQSIHIEALVSRDRRFHTSDE
jgi:hypothetical protein